MKAIVQNDYGSADVLQLKEVDKPVIREHEVLVLIYAAALNAGDVFSMRGSPWLARLSVGFPKPKDYILGCGRMRRGGRREGGIFPNWGRGLHCL